MIVHRSWDDALEAMDPWFNDERRDLDSSELAPKKVEELTW